MTRFHIDVLQPATTVMPDAVERPAFGRRDDPAVAVGWAIAQSTVAFPAAVVAMERRVAAIGARTARELVWLLEHPPLYTAGTSAHDADLLEPARFPIYRTGRGGQHTYHGPGQRIAYLMLDLGARRPDLRGFVSTVEEWIIRSLAAFGVTARRSPGRIGVWVPRPAKGAEREDKIAAIGLRVRHWVSFHGVALNVNPVLEHFSGIVPCGIRDQGVTSLADLGVEVPMREVDAILRREFEALFGPVTPSAAP